MPTQLMAGVAEVDITPVPGTQIAGDIGRPRPMESVLDPLYARALVVEGGDRRICLLSMDLLAITEPHVAEIRRRASEATGLAPDAIAVHVTQTHSAPCVGHLVCRDEWPYIPAEHEWLRGGAPEYHEVAVAGAVRAISQAAGACEPVTARVASGCETRVAFNRRFKLRGGVSVTHARYPDRSEVLATEGPIDPEVGVVQFDTSDGAPLSMLLSFTCHPTFGYPKRWVSADWCGRWVDGMKRRLGDGVTPMVINGCCGNIAPIHHLDPTHHNSMDLMGERLTETAVDALGRLTSIGDPIVDHRLRRIGLDQRRPDPAELEAARRLLEAHPAPMWRQSEPDAVEWDWLYAVGITDLDDRRQRKPVFSYEIQAFRIGDVALVVLPGEPFVETQIEIKDRSPVRHTYVVHMSNQYVGYIPTPEGLRRGGYETRTANWSQFEADSAGRIVEASLAMLNELFA